MIPKIVSDAGYTAVGLGVLVIQQVQMQRRETRARMSHRLEVTRHGLETAVGQVKARIEPLGAKVEPLMARVEPIKAKVEPIIKSRVAAPVASALGHLPHPHLPGPVSALVDSGRHKIQAALGRDGDQEPPASQADQGEAEATPAADESEAEAAPAESTD